MANVAGQSFLASASLDQTSSSERALQQQALADLLSVLLSAGYFRARVAGLPVFDKVVVRGFSARTKRERWTARSISSSPLPPLPLPACARAPNADC
jgi:hypothetical protein